MKTKEELGLFINEELKRLYALSLEDLQKEAIAYKISPENTYDTLVYATMAAKLNLEDLNLCKDVENLDFGKLGLGLLAVISKTSHNNTHREILKIKLDNEKKRLSELSPEELEAEANNKRLNANVDKGMLIEALALLSLSKEELKVWVEGL